MTTVDARIGFAERNVTAPDGTPFSLVGREWVREHYWRALGGWKLWPVDPDRLCSDCAGRANKLATSATDGDETQTTKHLKDCAGLKREPVLITAMKLKRQRGKSFNTAAWGLSKIFTEDHEHLVAVAGSEQQVVRIFDANWRGPVERSKKLEVRSAITGARIEVPARNSALEVLPTSITSVGGTCTVLILDECRAIPASVAIAMLPTLFARGGWTCPKASGHVKTHEGVDDTKAPRRCAVCKSDTVPWYGIALLMSSAGELTDTEDDWFAEFIDHYRDNPHPNVHVYEDDNAPNPKISKKLVDTVDQVFGALESTKALVDIEVHNQNRRKGDDVVSKRDLERCSDRRLVNLEKSVARCVGFLDTSTTVEKTSLNLFVEDLARSPLPWGHITQVRLDYWIPTEQPGGIIDPGEVKAAVLAVLNAFPGLIVMPVDTRGLAWPVTMLREIHAEHPRFKKILTAWNRNADESEIGWDNLQTRVMAQPSPTITLQADKHIAAEFKGVRWSFRRGSDSRLKVQDRNRRKSHKDITEGIAMCCYLAGREAMRGPRTGQARIAEILAGKKAPDPAATRRPEPTSRAGKLASALRDPSRFF